MKKQSVFRLLLFLSVALGAVAALLMSAAMLSSYGDGGRNYFNRGALLPLLAVITALLAGACGIAAAILSDAKRPCTPFEGILSAIPLCIACLAAVLLPFPPAAWALPVKILSVLCALYVLLATRRNAASPRATSIALLGFFAVALCAAVNVYCYFDVSLEMNAPVKVMIQTAYLFTMLYFTGELRYLLHREQPRLYLALALCTLAALSLPMLSIPGAYLSGILTRTDYFALALCALGLFVTVLLRVLTCVGIIKGRQPLEVTRTTAEEATNEEAAAEEDKNASPTPTDDEKETDEE